MFISVKRMNHLDFRQKLSDDQKAKIRKTDCLRKELERENENEDEDWDRRQNQILQQRKLRAAETHEQHQMRVKESI